MTRAQCYPPLSLIYETSYPLSHLNPISYEDSYKQNYKVISVEHRRPKYKQCQEQIVSPPAAPFMHDAERPDHERLRCFRQCNPWSNARSSDVVSAVSSHMLWALQFHPSFNGSCGDNTSLSLTLCSNLLSTWYGRLAK